MTPSDFANTYQPAAQTASDATGIPVLLILSQAALESGYGAHAPGNAFFGIKAGKSWTGATQMLDTHEFVNGVKVAIKAPFRAYSSPGDSFADWANFIKSNERYAPVLAASDTVSAAKALQSAGYSTSPTYADSLIVVAHKLVPSAIDATTYAESLAGVLGTRAKKDAAALVQVATSGPGLAVLALAGITVAMYFISRRYTGG
jgi:flagellar protein FlgJ